eukprot:6207073-Pleurochrysis_carterae.AAC.2
MMTDTVCEVATAGTTGAQASRLPQRPHAVCWHLRSKAKAVRLSCLILGSVGSLAGALET